MKFFQIIFTLILLTDYQSVSANFNYKTGDQLFVWAKSGLNMREGPSTDFSKIKKLNYGEKVEVVDKNPKTKSLDLTILKKSKKHNQFILMGHWIKVKIGNTEGYVFDGYLSRLPVMKMKETKDNKPYFEDFHEYASREFGIDSTALPTDSLVGYDMRTVFQNGMEYKYPLSECYFATWDLGKISFNEAYLIFEYMTDFENSAKNFKAEDIAFNDPDKPLEWTYFETTVEQENGYYHLGFDTDFHGMHLKMVDGKFIITLWGCC